LIKSDKIPALKKNDSCKTSTGLKTGAESLQWKLVGCKIGQLYQAPQF